MNPRIFGEILASDSSEAKLFSERIVLAHSDFLSIYNRLAAGVDLDVKTTLQSCVAHLDAIEDIGSQYNLYGIQEICKELRHYINTSIYGFDEYQLIVRKLVVWTDNVLIYLEDQDDLSIVQKLFEPLPQNTSIFLKTVMGLQSDSVHRVMDNDDVADAIELETNFIFIEDAIDSEPNVRTNVDTENSENSDDASGLTTSEVANEDLLSLVVAETVVAETAGAKTASPESEVDNNQCDVDDYLVMADDGFIPDSEHQTDEVEIDTSLLETESLNLANPAYLDQIDTDNGDYVLVGEDGVEATSSNQLGSTNHDSDPDIDEISTSLQTIENDNPIDADSDEFMQMEVAENELISNTTDDDNSTSTTSEQIDEVITHLEEIPIAVPPEHDIESEAIKGEFDEGNNDDDSLFTDKTQLALLVNPDDDKSMLLPDDTDDNDEINRLLDQDDGRFDTLDDSDDDEGLLLTDDDEELLLSDDEDGSEQIDEVITQLEKIPIAVAHDQASESDIVVHGPDDGRIFVSDKNKKETVLLSTEDESVSLLVNPDDDKSMLLSDDTDDNDEINRLLDEDDGHFDNHLDTDDDEGLLLSDSEDSILDGEEDDWLLADDDNSLDSEIGRQSSEDVLADSELAELESDPVFDFSDDGIFSADEQVVENDLLGVLHQEIKQIAPELMRLGNIISSKEDQVELDNAIQAYTELLQRLIIATDSMGLLGLQTICEVVLHNISLASSSEFSDRQKMSSIIVEWPDLVTAYLKNHQDDAGCISLVDHFQKVNWPSPISGEEARDLYVGLAEGMSACDEIESIAPRQTIANAEDVNLQISTDINEELLEAFFIEAPGQAEDFTGLIEQINENENLLENIKFAQRIAHTLKGSGNLIGASGIANLTHHLEDIFEYLANKNMAPPKPLCELLQEAADCLELMIEAVQGISPAPDNAQNILQGILDWANRVDQGNMRADDINSIHRNNDTVNNTSSVSQNTAEASAPSPAPSVGNSAEKEAQTTANVEMLRVPVHVVDELLRILGEVSIAISQVQEHNNRLQQRGKKLKLQDSAVQYQRFELENLVDIRNLSGIHRSASQNHNKDEAFDSLEMDQYDELYGTAHRYIESVADSREISQEIQSGLSTLDGLYLQQQHLNKELQQIIMTTRMITVESISSRLQRTIRQACKATGKKVNLEIVGGELLIDSNVLNKLVDPLMHMLRNAVDHGIESTQTRLDTEKHTTGLVRLTFKQIGNNVRVYCADDGSGLDFLRINEKACAKGIIAENDVLSNNELSRLILHPGFSTRDAATQTSGRGVGMDVVHATILDLKGTLDIQESDLGGTLFVMDLPISLVTNHSLVVKVDEESFAIPTNSLEQILAPHVGKVNSFGESSTYHLGKNVYTACSLRSLIGGKHEINEHDIMLIAKVDNGNVAIAVDQVVNSYDLVTKSTGDYVQNIIGTSGVTVLGDGSIVPVLDLPELLRTQTHSERAATQSIKDIDQQANTTNVLIVDDSLSMRKSLTQFIEDIGYRAVQARDGLEAADILKNQNIDIALVDMEMPRMNGIELTTHIRASEQNKNLPIIMITSRTQQKHRQKAEAAGVSYYLAKPYSEDTLMSSMESLLSEAV